jgi:hypothetical protein
VTEVEDWNRLVAALDQWGSAAVVAPGRIEVVLPGSGRRVEVVMTPREWDEMWSIAWGNLGDAIADVQRMLVGLDPEEGFAVYTDYQLEGSPTPTLPDLEDEDLPPGPGAWVALDRDGRVVSRLSEWRDDEDR